MASGNCLCALPSAKHQGQTSTVPSIVVYRYPRSRRQQAQTTGTAVDEHDDDDRRIDSNGLALYRNVGREGPSLPPSSWLVPVVAVDIVVDIVVACGWGGDDDDDGDVNRYGVMIGMVLCR